MSAERRDRRRLLFMLCAWGAAWLGRNLPSPLADETALADTVRQTFPDYATARTIGKAYLAAAWPAEQRPADLWRAIVAAHPLGQAPTTQKQVASWVQRDFADAAMVNLDGWFLSRTEARFCALAVLLG